MVVRNRAIVNLNGSARGGANGFTLIEITIAIFLLASALTIILGLHVSSVSRAINDQSSMQAMLLARRILTSIETGQTRPETQDNYSSATEFLVAEDISPEEEEMLSKFMVNLKIEQWEIPGYEDIKVKRIFLKVDWGEQPEQTLSIYFFVPDNEDESIKQERESFS